MHTHDLRGLIAEFSHGRLSRRSFLTRLAALGITGSLASVMLSGVDDATAQGTQFAYKPTKRGGGGVLKLLWWQGPTLLNPHFAVGLKDQEGSRLFYEPLAAWGRDGKLVPILAAEIPTRDNGGVAADGKSVVWKLKRGVRWHDGQPVTADDLVFNWEYATDPATATVTISTYKSCKVEKVDEHAIRVSFDKPTPFWADPFVGAFGMVIPKHLFAAFKGPNSRDAPTNLKPVGTGPYRFVDFKPGDLIKGVINPDYHQVNKPHFDAIEMKGGGDAVSAARAVLQTGEFDFAWNLQVEDEILLRLEAGKKGRVVIFETGNIEYIQLNNTDPWTETDGERSHANSRHPILSDPAVRQALTLLIDRKSIQEHIYGRTGVVTANVLNAPPEVRSSNTSFAFDIDKAASLLEAAGWTVGADGIREKAGKKLKLVFQTSINAPRQKTQQIVKQAARKAGIEIEIKGITGSIFFSSDVGNPDTFSKFNADLQMLTITMSQPDPVRFMKQFFGAEVATKANKWQGRNVTRWRNDEYDRTLTAAENELEPGKRIALFIKLNDLVINNQVVIPVVARPFATAAALSLQPHLSGWDNGMAFLADWYREA
ncbi:MAG: peptide ABC transporter substrate-binding protein [Hyphomicrobiaceae bacterium]